MMSKLINALIRNRARLCDLNLIVAVVLVTAFITWQVDVFATENSVSTTEKTIELNELLLLGGLLAVGLLVYSIRRLSEQKREMRRRLAAEQHVRELAYQDGLTGLSNRRQFEDALKVAMDSPPGAGAMHAVFLLDLNGFKKINDCHGHGTGDEVLIIAAQRLLGAIRDGDLVARFGGDEFAILSKHLIDAEAAASIARRVIQALEAPLSAGNTRHQISAAIGIALIPKDATTLQESLRKADIALYRAKSEHRSAFRFFEEDMDRLMRERDQLERDLRTAIETGDIRVSYQPLMDLRTHAILGFEAAPTWNHEVLGDVSAERFISVADECGLIYELSEGLLRQACAAASHWPPSTLLSFELFPAQLADRELTTRIFQILEETDLSPGRLEIEIAESALVRHLRSVQDILGPLRARGVKIAVGNFGSGYSSLYHLRNFKLDKIKIDRAFVETMNSDPQSAEIVSALIGLGHGFGFTVSAEGVGDLKQSATLLGSGCQQGQGSFFAGAMSAETIMDFLALQKGSGTNMEVAHIA